MFVTFKFIPKYVYVINITDHVCDIAKYILLTTLTIAIVVEISILCYLLANFLNKLVSTTQHLSLICCCFFCSWQTKEGDQETKSSVQVKAS